MANSNVTVSNATPFGNATPLYTERYEVSALTAGLRATLTHTGPSGTAASTINWFQSTPATDGSPVTLSYFGTDTSNDEIDVEFAVPVGGSLDGFTATIFVGWAAHARQDGQSITEDNNT